MSDEAKKVDDGGPAFPTDGESQVSARLWHFSGLTKREWFAGMALQGLLANNSIKIDSVNYLARSSYGFSDAMLRAEKGEK